MSNKLCLNIFSIGELATNAYVIFDAKTKKCFVVDCPKPIDEYRDFIQGKGLDLEFVIFTHGHFDHINGLEEFLKEFPVSFYIHKSDASLLVNPTENGSLLFDLSAPVLVKQKPIFCEGGGEISFGKHKLKIIHTPGHTQGGISIKMGERLFSGDTLFYHSVGRTDLLFGDAEQLKNSIKNKIFTLNPKIAVYPGHGEKTSIGEEIKNNPFV